MLRCQEQIPLYSALFSSHHILFRRAGRCITRLGCACATVYSRHMDSCVDRICIGSIVKEQLPSESEASRARTPQAEDGGRWSVAPCTCRSRVTLKFTGRSICLIIIARRGSRCVRAAVLLSMPRNGGVRPCYGRASRPRGHRVCRQEDAGCATVSVCSSFW
jgi:hypothetical protein